MSAAASAEPGFRSRKDDPEEVELVLEQLAEEAAAAREHPSQFFEFVMHPEDSLDPLAIAAHQRLFFDFVMHHRKCVVLMPIDHSKCHGKGTPVLMANGEIRPVEDVRVGDRVMGPDGPKRVLITSSDRGQLFRIVPKRGDPFVVNEDHILTLVESGTDKVIDVPLYEYLRWSRWKHGTHKLFRVPVLKFDGEKAPDIDPYFLGLWFGDGNHSTKHVVLTNVDDAPRLACLEIAAQYGLAVVPNPSSGGQTFRLSKPGGKGAGARGNKLLDAIREAVGPGLSMAKVKTAPWAYRAAFLAGFIDADGGMRDNCVYIAQKRADWARDIAFIARSLGIGVSESTQENPVHGTYQMVTLYGTRLAEVPIRVERKRVGARRDIRGRKPKDSLRTGFRVEPLGEGDFYGFTIGGDGRYLLGDFTVTHNTFCAAALVMWLLGNNPRLRGGIVSAAEAQAKKPLALVKDYIEQSPQLRLVFPDLKPSERTSDPWTDDVITVERPYGIRDPSLGAFGLDSRKIVGSRWDFAILDDLLNDDNTGTPEQREKVERRAQKDIESRVDARRGRVIYINTARHPEDVVQKRSLKWPTLVMRCDGTIQIYNAPDFDSPHIRPADDLPPEDPNATYRLTAHDAVNDNGFAVYDELTPLWPERWPTEAIEERRREWLPEAFAQNMMNVPLSDAASLCKQAYLDVGLRLARWMGVTGFVLERKDVRLFEVTDEIAKQVRLGKTPTELDVKRLGGAEFSKGGDFLVFTGVDLAVSKKSGSDNSSVFSFAVFPRGIRVPLAIDYGKWGAKEIEERVFDHIVRFRPAGVSVENVAAQELFRQVLAERQEEIVRKDLRVPIKPFTTSSKKHDPFFGVPALFAEFAGGLWAIPNDRGVVRPEVRRWMNECISYNPTDHTGDVLMSQYFASELAKKFGAIQRMKAPTDVKRGPGIAASLRAR